jgi:membrane fusion protein, heavy metal efflux system
VQAGQTLFTLSGAGIANNDISATVQTTRAEFSKAKTDYERAKELIKDQLISKKEFEEIQLRYQNTLTTLNTLTKGYSAGGKNHATPMAGFIKTISVAEGQFVSAGTPLATISQNKRLMLRAEISQKDFGKVSTIQGANFVTPDKRTFSTAALNGRLVSVAQTTSGNSMMLPVFFEIDNTGNLVSGSVVEVYLQSGIIPSALVLPVSALILQPQDFTRPFPHLCML